MIIDWVTVAAQTVNFLILVWLMKRFLFKPVLNAIEDREKRIASELANADQKKAEAQKEREEFQHKNDEFDQQRAALLSKASDEAQAERDRLLSEARKAAAILSSKMQETLKTEEQNLHHAISLRIQQEVFFIARKIMEDLAGTSLEERMVEVFVRRLLDLGGKEKELLVSAIKASTGPVTVHTAYDLSSELRKSTEDAIKETLGVETRIRFEVVPELIGGIELAANGQKVAWSISDYLSSLKYGVDEILQKQDIFNSNPSKSETKTESEESKPTISHLNPGGTEHGR